MARTLPPRIDLARLDRVDNPARNQREDAEQSEGDDKSGREDAGERFDAGELGAGVDVDDGPGEHADLAHPVEGPGSKRRQPHHQIDDKKRKSGHQPQRKQVELAVTLDAVVDRIQVRAKARLDRLAEQETRGEESERCADAGGE